ncbi:hypothetical protein Tsubulata_006068 [Turnera subulata]|uniref:FAD-binding PCMH-type domain-containing protein n=1 Tax=Turnera subulata TaxID=218843 RepID=A0A9Q0FIM3_9ROSI|nr:hypothetical protein Tsubulata_006068 [Turnera subulata]
MLSNIESSKRDEMKGQIALKCLIYPSLTRLDKENNGKHLQRNPNPTAKAIRFHPFPFGPLSICSCSISFPLRGLHQGPQTIPRFSYRGFPVTTAFDFNRVVEAFGYEELAYSGNDTLRTHVVGRVYTANESPLDQNISFHHEMNRLPVFPSKLFFFCEVEPKSGGETPLAVSHVVHNKIKERYPDFVKRLEDPGLIYTRILPEENDLSSPIGRGWRSIFSTQDKSVAEERAAKLKTRLEWLEQGGVKAITGPLPAIRYDESRNRKIWFNAIGGAARTHKGKDPLLVITFGDDGDPLPVDILLDCLNILEDESVAIPWQRGDFMLVDNLAEPIKCSSRNTNCVITNSYGSFPDRATCRAGNVAYPTTEEEHQSQHRLRCFRSSFYFHRWAYGHSIPKLVCPDGDNGLLISTKYLNRTLAIDVQSMTMSVESGVTLRQEIQIPQQKHYDSIPSFPAVVSPSVPSPSLPLFIDSIKTHKPFLESLLHKAGAVLFRGFPVTTASDFNDVVEAFGYEEMSYADGAAPRTHVVGRVYTANESPPELVVPFHHEMALNPASPSKLFFFCEVEPKSGGETPLVLSHLVHDTMKEKYPDFVQRIADHGLTYTRVLPAETNPSAPIGVGWKSTFSTQDRKVAEERATKHRARLEWLDDSATDSVKVITGPVPSIRYDKSRNRNIWFNSIYMASTLKDGQNNPVATVAFGDGKPLAQDIVQDCIKIVDAESVTIPWQKGDVMLIDNLAPKILSPSVPVPSLSFLVDAIKAHKPFLDSLLFNTGAVLFRGFPVSTDSDFNDVVEAFGYEELPYTGGAGTRTHVVGRVYTSNEAPLDLKIPFHHEMCPLPVFPSKLFFFCEVEPTSGGETPIVLSHVVHNKIREKYPDFVRRLEDPGLIYAITVPKETDLSHPTGRGWRFTYSTEDKSVAEERAAKLNTRLEWLENGGVKSIIGPVQGIRYDEARDRKTWFNVIGAAARTEERKDPLIDIKFGDGGEPLPVDILLDCIKILEEESVAIPWQRGDFILLDNLAVLHGRRSGTPPRPLRYY